ncbi:MAG: hypothetical protein LDL44_12430 [Caenispirillum sp.]|nr:hypothetical protein [Caenispirillum sp.]
MSLLKVQVRNVRAVERADIETSRIALLCGQNEAGKSSILMAAGAALCGRHLPQDDMTKADVPLLVRSGAAGAKVRVTGPHGSVAVSWPKMEAASEGVEPPHASLIACGFEHPLRMGPRERAKLFAGVLKSDPDKSDLAAALRDAIEISDEGIDALWAKVEKLGWDGAWKEIGERRAKAKGRWEAATRTQYGANKAKSWEPEGWRDDLEGLDESDLIARVPKAQQAIDAAVAAASVDAATMESLREAIAAGPKDSEKDAAAQAWQNAVAVLRRAEDARKALPPAEGGEAGLPCPHCGGAITVRQDLGGPVLVATPAGAIDDAETDRRRKAIASADKVLAAARKAHDDTHRAVVEIGARGLKAEEAKRALEKAEKDRAAAGNVAPGLDVDGAKRQHTQALADLDMWRRRREADLADAEVRRMDAIAGVLAPTALRQEKLQRVLGSFNDSFLAPICEAAGWKPVVLRPDLSVTYGGCPYIMLSRAAKCLVGVVLQLAIARLDGSQVVIIDDADVLVGPHRRALLNAVVAAGLPYALIGMAVSRPDQVPDLAGLTDADGEVLGTTWWIADGTAVPRAEALPPMQEAA